jgi:hypothetical protein
MVSPYESVIAAPPTASDSIRAEVNVLGAY